MKFGGPSTHEGQDAHGRFTPGNLMGRGNPLAGRAAKIRSVLVAHRRKSPGGTAADQALGSRAFTGVARAVWQLTRDRQFFRPRPSIRVGF